MTFPADFAEQPLLNARHVARSQKFWTRTEQSHGLPSGSQSPSSGRAGDAAVQDVPPSIVDLRTARKTLRRLGVSVARPPAVTPVPRIPVVHPSFVSFAAERVLDGPWGPAVWVVSNVVTGHEVARYPSHEIDGPGAILRHLKEQAG